MEIKAVDHELPDGYTQISPAVQTFCFLLMGGVSIREGFEPDLVGRTDVFAWPGRNGLVQVPCPTDKAQRCESCIVDCDSMGRVMCGDELIVAEGHFDSSKVDVPRVSGYVARAEALGNVIDLTGSTD